MTFLNPAILWGLAAVSVPILIHIFNLRRTKKIEFSTLMFLKEIQQTRYKKIKFKQLLILLCRIAFVISLVIAFARPFTSGYLGAAGEIPRSSILFLLDDSFSMQERETEGSSFDNAKKKLTETLGITADNDELYFSPVSKLGIQGENLLYTDPGELKDTILKTKISDVTKDLDGILFYADRILENSSNPYKEIFYFTDGQKSTLNSVNPETNIFDKKGITKFNIVLSSVRTGNNISIDTVNVLTKIFEKHKSVKIRCTVTNRNTFNVSNKSIILNFSGAKNYRDEKVIDIPAGSSVETEFSFIPGITGYCGGNIEIVDNILADDELINDNKRYFSFKIPERVNVLFISPSASDLDYVRLALTASEELMRDSLNNSADFFVIKQTGTNDIQNTDPKNFDCIVIAGKQSFTQAEAGWLNSYMQNGGGVIIYPGSDISIDNYNRVLMKTLDLPFINPSFGNAPESQPFRFDKIDLEHPIFDGIFRSSSGQDYTAGESPHVRTGLSILTGQNSIPLIKLNNEKNFLVEYTCGKGKLLFYSVAPDMKNSDFPVSNLFAPITVRSIIYLSNRSQFKEAVTGKDYFLDIKNFGSVSPGDTLHIVTNDGTNSLIVRDSNLVNLKNYIVNSSNYRIYRKNILIGEYPANFDRRESDLEKFTPSELVKLFREKYKTEINVFTPDEKLTASILSARNGREIWRYFIILALIFIALEFYISRSIMTQSQEQ